MAPSVFSQNSIAWSAVPVAVFLSYLWLRRKKVEYPCEVDFSPKVIHTDEEDLEELGEPQPLLVTPRKSTRSLSGVESAPIDISYPPELRLTNSNEYVPDEDLDTELRRASSSNIFDRYQAVNQSVTSEHIDPVVNKSSGILDSLDQISTQQENKTLVNSQTLEDNNHQGNIFVKSEISVQNDNMTQFDTSNNSVANQPEQGDILSQSFQNEMMAHEHSHFSNESSTQIESADTMISSNYAAQLKEVAPTEVSEEAITPAEACDETYTPVEILKEVVQIVEPSAEVTLTVEASGEATTPEEASDKAYTPVEISEEVVPTVEASEEAAIAETSDKVYTPVEISEEVSPLVETSEETVSLVVESLEKVSLVVETSNKVSWAAEIAEETAQILKTGKVQPVLNNAESQVAEAAAQISQTVVTAPQRNGAFPKRKKQKFRPIPLETITGGKSNSYSRNKRRNERRKNVVQSEEIVEAFSQTCQRATANSPTAASSSSMDSLVSSVDSGKGCSELASPPASRLSPTNEAKDEIVSFSFTIPHKHVGWLKGGQSNHINMIKRTTHVDINLMITNPRATDPLRKQQVCTIRGTQKGVDRAISILKQRFPKSDFPEVTFLPVQCPRTYTKPYKIPIRQNYATLSLDISNDTVVSCMEQPDHLHLHLHLSPDHTDLPYYTSYLNQLYSTENDNQFMPNDVHADSCCVALYYNNWYRALILSTYPETNTSQVKLLDYGGKEYLSNDCLRKYHISLMYYPFQAIECYLFNVKPKGGEVWCEEAYNCVTELTLGVVIATYIKCYRGDVPEVVIYLNNGVCLNEELVRRDLAEYVSLEYVTTSKDDSACAQAV